MPQKFALTIVSTAYNATVLKVPLGRWQAELNHQVALANYHGISMSGPIIDDVLKD